MKDHKVKRRDEQTLGLVNSVTVGANNKTEVNIGVDPNFIYIKRGGVPKERCNFIIKNFELGKNYVPGTLGTAREIDYQRKSCVEEFVKINNGNPYDNLFWPYLNIACGEYVMQYPFLKALDPWGLYETYKIQKYKPNEGYFDLHSEVTGAVETNGDAAARMMVWMIYLNDVTEGGYTIWPVQEKTVAPRCGDIVIWPAFWTHPHKGIASKTQTKYILTGWWEFKGLTFEQQQEKEKELVELHKSNLEKHEEWVNSKK
jgi:hypothetical protein